MEALYIYLIKSSGLIALFYLAYYFMLRKETFFTSNRWFLLLGLFTSVVLPLIVYTKIIMVESSSKNIDWSRIPITNSIENEAFEINWYIIFGITYAIGIILFLGKFVFDFYSLNTVLKGKRSKIKLILNLSIPQKTLLHFPILILSFTTRPYTAAPN